MQAREQKHGHAAFVVPTNSALYSAKAASRAIAVLAIRAAGFALSWPFSGTLKTGNLSRPEQLRLFSLDGEHL
jgi:hypothetical protein